MTPNKNPKIIKYCAITSSMALLLITIFLIPISRKASYWNKCLDKTVRWINLNEKDLKGWDRAAKQSLAVAVCNGAVYEPKFK